MRVRIRDKQEVAKGTLLVTFDLLGEEMDFTPGQYFHVTLPNLGDDDDKGLRRHITVVTSPNIRPSHERGFAAGPDRRLRSGPSPRPAV